MSNQETESLRTKFKNKYRTRREELNEIAGRTDGYTAVTNREGQVKYTGDAGGSFWIKPNYTDLAPSHRIVVEPLAKAFGIAPENIRIRHVSYGSLHETDVFEVQFGKGQNLDRSLDNLVRFINEILVPGTLEGDAKESYLGSLNKGELSTFLPAGWGRDTAGRKNLDLKVYNLMNGTQKLPLLTKLENTKVLLALHLLKSGAIYKDVVEAYTSNTLITNYEKEAKEFVRIRSQKGAATIC